jgi:excinuclease ABC subunit C
MLTKEKLNLLPEACGVYKYLDKNGQLLYVGKANNLRKRVKSYWRFKDSLRPNPNLSSRILKMLKEVDEVEYILVDSPVDALILENSLIKKLRPKYNILLRDDKTYPYIYIDLEEDFPRFEITRKILEKKKILYWGPFPQGANSLLKSLYDFFPLVQKKGLKRQKGACLFYQIKKCLAPCEGKISKEEYKKILDQAIKALENPKILIQNLNLKMLTLAQNERFEEALEIKKLKSDLEKLQLHSSLEIPKRESFDLFVIEHDQIKGIILRFFVRDGRVISSSYTFFRDLENLDLAKLYKQELISFYNLQIPLVKKIVLGSLVEDKEEIEEFLSKKSDQKIEVLTPKRGYKADLIKLALKNAKEILKNSYTQVDFIKEALAKRLKLKKVPNKIEIFDNSSIYGEDAVGAMVVWSENSWEKDSFRRFNLEAKDEYSQTKELLKRRLKEIDSLPDLWIIDGGDLLRDLAIKILKEANLEIDVIAISKEKVNQKSNRAKGKAKDKIHFCDGIIEIEDQKDLLWVQRLRDKAHSFALASHRKKRLNSSLKSNLLSINGIGQATLKRLLDYFGSFEAIYLAKEEELSMVVGKAKAKAIKNAQKGVKE